MLIVVYGKGLPMRSLERRLAGARKYGGLCGFALGRGGFLPWAKTSKGPHPTTATGARRLAPDHLNARGAYRKWPIDKGVTDEYIPKLQAYLKTLPGGDAMAKKVEGWGAFSDASRRKCYVDRDARKCYRSMSKVADALKA